VINTQLILIGLMSRWIRHRFSFYQVYYLAPMDTLCHNVWYWFFLSSGHLMTAFEDRILQIFCKINLVYAFRIQVHNLDCKIITANTQIPIGFAAFQYVRRDIALISV